MQFFRLLRTKEIILRPIGTFRTSKESLKGSMLFLSKTIKSHNSTSLINDQFYKNYALIFYIKLIHMLCFMCYFLELKKMERIKKYGIILSLPLFFQIRFFITENNALSKCNIILQILTLFNLYLYVLISAVYHFMRLSSFRNYTTFQRIIDKFLNLHN